MITEKEITNQIKNNVIAVINSTGFVRILKVRENISSRIIQQVPIYQLKYKQIANLITH